MKGPWSIWRFPRFRRDLFLRDEAFDPDKATGPRITVPHVLPSMMINTSALQSSVFRGSIPHLIGSLCTFRHGRRLPCRNTHYRAGATLTQAGLSPARSRQLRLAHNHNRLHRFNNFQDRLLDDYHDHDQTDDGQNKASHKHR